MHLKLDINFLIYGTYSFNNLKLTEVLGLGLVEASKIFPILFPVTHNPTVG